LTRFGLHLAFGMAIVKLAYPLLGPRRRAALRRGWCRGLLAALGVRLQVVGAAPAHPVLVAANHVSWLDIFAIGAALPCTFVSKEEARSWPIVGWLAAHNATLFLRRHSPRAVHRVKREVAARLAQAETVVVFPEGTTSEGASVLPFNPALFQAAVDAASRVLPVAVQYYDHAARRTAAAAYVGDDPLWKSLRAVLDAPSIHVHLFFGDCLQGTARRELAAAARRAVLRLHSPAAQPSRHLVGYPRAGVQGDVVAGAGTRAQRRLPRPGEIFGAARIDEAVAASRK
jgi:1-acyl-sn-glycerol-3-phosphate acyltransferase